MALQTSHSSLDRVALFLGSQENNHQRWKGGLKLDLPAVSWVVRVHCSCRLLEYTRISQFIVQSTLQSPPHRNRAKSLKSGEGNRMTNHYTKEIQHCYDSHLLR